MSASESLSPNQFANHLTMFRGIETHNQKVNLGEPVGKDWTHSYDYAKSYALLSRHMEGDEENTTRPPERGIIIKAHIAKNQLVSEKHPDYDEHNDTDSQGAEWGERITRPTKVHVSEVEHLRETPDLNDVKTRTIRYNPPRKVTTATGEFRRAPKKK
jgi:hypothetical protein